MSVVSADQLPSASTLAQPLRFWQRLAQALDEHFAERSKGAVPAIILRRSRREFSAMSAAGAQIWRNWS
jgi:hypothetical protein